METKTHDSTKDIALDTNNNLNNTAAGIWSDGITMWVANDDGDRDRIVAYNMATKAHDSAKDFNTLVTADNIRPTGIWSDGKTMWVGDIYHGKIFAYDLYDYSP